MTRMDIRTFRVISQIDPEQKFPSQCWYDW